MVSERLTEEIDCMRGSMQKPSGLLFSWAGARNGFEKNFYICSETENLPIDIIYTQHEVHPGYPSFKLSVPIILQHP